MQFTTPVTQKGQVTLPKKLRDQLGIAPFDQVIISLQKNAISIQSTKDILQLAGSIKAPKKKSILDAREQFEKEYRRF